VAAGVCLPLGSHRVATVVVTWVAFPGQAAVHTQSMGICLMRWQWAKSLKAAQLAAARAYAS
jgi:hypothetical protein